MKSNSFPKAFLFDFDGVVVDSFEVHYRAWKSAFYELFQEEIPPFPHEKLAGKSPLLIAEYFCNTLGQAEKALELHLLKATHLHAGTTPPTLLPGVREIQGFLAAQNIPHGIASNATKAFLTNSISQLSLGFTTWFGVEDYVYPKPHPEAYISLAKNLGIEKEDFENTWVFEDSLAGTTAAKKAGMVPIGILTVYSETELKAAGSQFVFPTLQEAYEYLLAQNR